ncbi:MAG: single-stranded DNA-binding protein [gamma proteobacterium endosymbiont of Lamellibrachia anaximandri]|nr:single-stranded DNA-binding protein [gamma proteobacterium endosymbiont of Lamellibrachia anaximandri]
MSANFNGTGNLGNTPSLRHVRVEDEERPVCEFRVFFDRSKPDGEGGYEDIGGFWLTVNVWGKRAEAAARHLAKGTRVKVEGRLKQDSWEDKESGEPRVEIRLDADDVTLALSRIEQVRFMPKSETSETDEVSAD